MKYLIDSSGWIEYLEGGEKGEKVNEILKGDNDIYIIAINIGEVVSKAKAKKMDTETAYKTIVTNANLLNITPRIAKESGLLHSETRKKMRSFSLADAFIIKSAQAISAKVLTTDRHFKNFKEAIIL